MFDCGHGVQISLSWFGFILKIGVKLITDDEETMKDIGGFILGG